MPDSCCSDQQSNILKRTWHKRDGVYPILIMLFPLEINVLKPWLHLGFLLFKLEQEGILNMVKTKQRTSDVLGMHVFHNGKV